MRLIAFLTAMMIALPAMAAEDGAAGKGKAAGDVPPAPQGPFRSTGMQPEGGPQGGNYPPMNYDPEEARERAEKAAEAAREQADKRQKFLEEQAEKREQQIRERQEAQQERLEKQREQRQQAMDQRQEQLQEQQQQARERMRATAEQRQDWLEERQERMREAMEQRTRQGYRRPGWYGRPAPAGNRAEDEAGESQAQPGQMPSRPGYRGYYGRPGYGYGYRDPRTEWQRQRSEAMQEQAEERSEAMREWMEQRNERMRQWQEQRQQMLEQRRGYGYGPNHPYGRGYYGGPYGGYGYAPGLPPRPGTGQAPQGNQQGNQ